MLFALLALLAVAAGPGSGDESDAAARHAALVAHVDGLAEQFMASGRAVGMVVGVLDGERRWVAGYGSVSLDDPTPPDGRTIYEIGSLTKAFTLVLLHESAARGLLSPDDPVQDLLPDGVAVPERGGVAIRLSHLAEHSAGFPREHFPLRPKDPANPYDGYTVDHIHRALAGLELGSTPGERREYSNFGYGLLGHVLCRANGCDYDTLLTTRLAGPLGMPDTRVRLSPEQRARLAPPYDEQRRPRAPLVLDAMAGAGAAHSTVDDLLVWARAVVAPEASPLGDVIRAAYLAGVEVEPGRRRPARWADLSDDLAWSAAGRTNGAKSQLVVLPNRDRALVVLAATDSVALDDLARRMAEPLKTP